MDPDQLDPLLSGIYPDATHEPTSAPIEETETPAARKKRLSRTKTGCLTCRKRKIKCDESYPNCRRCNIGLRECTWPQVAASFRRDRSARGLHDHLPASPEYHDPYGAYPTSSVQSAGLLPRPAGSSYGQRHARETAPMDLVPSGMRPTLMSNPSFLQPYFPSLDERLTIHHYFNHTTKIILAYCSEKKPWNPWLSVHAPLAFNHPPGTSPAADALRTAMLAVGSVHLHYLQNSKDQRGVLAVARNARAKVMKLVKESSEKRMGGWAEGGGVARMEGHDEGEGEMELSALLSCTIASSLSGDDAWGEVLSAAINHVDSQGGAQALLRRGSRTRLSPYRFCLEQLAIRNTVGCLTTGMAPTVLNIPFLPWFFEAEGWSCNEGERESVEIMFGISRGMVDLIARACMLVAKVRETGYHIQLREEFARPPTDRANNESSAFQLRLPNRQIKIPQLQVSQPNSYLTPDTPDESNSPIETETDEIEQDRLGLEEAANDLVAEMRVWEEATNFLVLSERTQYGNHAHRLAMRIHLLRNVFGAKGSDARVLKAAFAILELALELMSWYGKITWFTWPVLISGLHIPKGNPGRKTALDLLGEFGPHACFDNQWATFVLREYWARVDNAQDPDEVTWWSVTASLGKLPFFD